MILFYSIVGGLVFIALAFILFPLLRPRQARGPLAADTLSPAPDVDELQAASIRVYHHQLADLHADLENGTLSQQQFDTAKIDLQRSLLEAAGSGGKLNPVQRKSWYLPTGLVAFLLLPVFSVLIYQQLGEGERGVMAASSSSPGIATGAPGQGMMDQAGIEAAVEALARRLEENPRDPDGWAMLGRSLTVLNQFNAAAGAYAQAIRNGGENNPEILVAYADLIGALDGGDLSLRARPFLERALEIAPNHLSALWLGGLANYQAGELEKTLAYWGRLTEHFPPGSEEGRLLRDNLNTAQALYRAQEAETVTLPEPGEEQQAVEEPTEDTRP